MVDSKSEDTIEMLQVPLRHYTNGVYREVIDFRKVVLARELVSEGVWRYDVPERPIYLGADGYAVTYDRQKVENGNLYYKFTDEVGVPSDMEYEYVASYEWKKTWRPPVTE